MTTGSKNEQPDAPLFMEVRAFVERSGLRRGTVERLIEEGKLTVRTEGGVRYIASGDLKRLPEIMLKPASKLKGADA